MFRVGINIYSNSQVKDTSSSRHPFQKKVRALVTGPCGHGKTHFINNTCNTKYKVGITKGSLTRDIVFEDFAYLPPGILRIYDTPGSNSSVDALEHALVLRASLTNLNLNLILIQAMFSKRFEQTIANFAQLLKIFKGYESIVVFMVSHGDLIEKESNRQQILSEFGSTLKEYGLNNTNVIIYSNINSNFIQLSNILYKIGSRNQLRKIVIDDNTFYKHFNISSPMTGLKTKQMEDYIDQIRDVADMCIEFAESISKQKQVDLNELLPQLKIYMKFELKRIQYQQYSKYSISFTDEKTTNFFLMISQFIQSKLEQLDQSSYFKISKQFYEDSNQKSSDIRDVFRACPNCGLIWMKVMGCDGQTTCGNKPNFYDYFKNKDLYTFSFVCKNGKLMYKKQKQNRVSSNMQQFFKYKLSTNDKGIGCGKTFVWGGEKDRIPNIEQMLKNIYKVSNFQEIVFDLNQIKIKKKQHAKHLDQKVKETINVIEKDKMNEKNSYVNQKAVKNNNPQTKQPTSIKRQTSINYLRSIYQKVEYPRKQNLNQENKINNFNKIVFSYGDMNISRKNA